MRIQTQNYQHPWRDYIAFIKVYKSRQILRNQCPSFSKILHSIQPRVYQKSIKESPVPNNRVSLRNSELQNRNSFSHMIENLLLIKDEKHPHSSSLHNVLHYDSDLWSAMLGWLNAFFSRETHNKQLYVHLKCSWKRGGIMHQEKLANQQWVNDMELSDFWHQPVTISVVWKLAPQFLNRH